MSKQFWFGRKKYGYGWVPSSIEGWVVIAVYSAVVIGSWYVLSANIEEENDVTLPFVAVAIVSTLILLVIVTKKGQKPLWQWGNKTEAEPKDDETTEQ